MTEKKKKTFLGHIRLLKAPGHSSSQDGSNSQVDQGTHSFCHPFSLTLPRPMARPRGKCLSLPICRSHGQGVPFGCRQSLYLNCTVAGTDFQEKQRSGPPDKRPDFHTGYWVDSGLHGGHSCHGIITDGDCLSSMGVLISFGQQWEKTSSPKTGELLVKQAAACLVKPNLQKECWGPL